MKWGMQSKYIISSSIGLSSSVLKPLIDSATGWVQAHRRGMDLRGMDQLTSARLFTKRDVEE